MPHRKRILTLDILRGFFLLVIFTDHLFRFPSFMEIFTGEGLLWVSAAEGFFIISGLLVGYIYGQKIASGFRDMLSPIWKRAGKLYLLSISLTLLFTFWGHYLPPDKIKPELWVGGNPFILLYKIVTLQYVYGWADFLVYYAVFMFFAPLALGIGKKYGSWLVFATSLTAWYFFHRSNTFFAWQLLFYSGLIIGNHLTSIEKQLYNMSNKLRYSIENILKITTTASILLSLYFVFGLGPFHPDQKIINFVQPFFDKNTVGLGRFILAWLWFSTIFLFVRSREGQIDKITRGIIRKLGQNSLVVYSLQSILLFPVNILLPWQFGFFGNTFLTLIAYGILYYGALKPKILVLQLRETVNENISHRTLFGNLIRYSKAFTIILIGRLFSMIPPFLKT